MKNMENKKSKIKRLFRIIISVILIIIFINMFFINNSKHKQKIDDFLFLKFLSNAHIDDKSNFNSIQNLNSSSSSNNIKKLEEYKFNVKYQNIDSQIIDLRKIIAPGTSDEFSILLSSNQNLKYRIQFLSVNEKPKNLKFLAIKDEKEIAKEDTLEKLSENIDGIIKKDEEIRIIIKYYWDYEGKTEEDNIQDTIDSKNIKTYEFYINVIGEELD